MARDIKNVAFKGFNVGPFYEQKSTWWPLTSITEINADIRYPPDDELSFEVCIDSKCSAIAGRLDVEFSPRETKS
jgi:hypothetical protein